MRQTSHEDAILWHVCGRYYRTEDKQQLAEYFQAIVTGDPLTYAPGFNIAPTTIQPVLRLERDTNFRELVPMRWGLVGFGGSGPDPKRSTFNARAEGLESSSLWRQSSPPSTRTHPSFGVLRVAENRSQGFPLHAVARAAVRVWRALGRMEGARRDLDPIVCNNNH
jgi:hypothetical protein